MTSGSESMEELYASAGGQRKETVTACVVCWNQARAVCWDVATDTTGAGR